MKHILIVVVICSLASCKAILTEYYGVNRKMKFKNAQEYVQHMHVKKKFPLADILIPDSSGYYEFMSQADGGGELSVLFGSFVNDSVALKKSATLQEQVGCMGRVLTDLENNIEVVRKGDTSLLTNSKFKNLVFRQAINGEPYAMNQETKPLKIILLYYYAVGRAFDKQYKEIFEFAAKHEKDVVIKIIATDKIATTL